MPINRRKLQPSPIHFLAEPISLLLHRLSKAIVGKPLNLIAFRLTFYLESGGTFGGGLYLCPCVKAAADFLRTAAAFSRRG
jgi:hypothetical protein